MGKFFNSDGFTAFGFAVIVVAVILIYAGVYS